MERAQLAAAIERCGFNRGGGSSQNPKLFKSGSKLNALHTLARHSQAVLRFTTAYTCAVAVLFFSSCSPSQKVNRIKAQDDIRETVFRYQFAQFQRTNERVYFLTIGGQDPPDEFMQRFGDSKSFVKKGSEAK